jgi:hypothetical protein
LCFGFTWIMPDSSHKKSETRKNDSRVLRNYLRQSKKDMADLQKQISQHEGTQELAKKIAQSVLDIEDLQKALQQVDVSDEQKAVVRQKMQDLMEQQEAHQESFNQYKNMKSSGQSLSSQERELFNQLMAKSDGNLSQQERDMLRSYMNRSMEKMAKGDEKARGMDLTSDKQQTNGEGLPEGNGLAGSTEGPISNSKETVGASKGQTVQKEQMDAVSKLLEKENLTPSEKQTLNEALKQVIKANEAVPSKTADKTVSQLPNQTMKAEVVKALEPKIEKPTILERLKKYLPFIVGFIVFALINYLLRKKGVNKIEVSDPEALEELKAEWKALRKLKLSPRDEVIHYYNLFHDSLQKIHYPDHEAPPSCIIYDDMKIHNAELDKSTLVITEVFAQCYYGDKKVTVEALKLFRKALSKILNVYQLN